MPLTDLLAMAQSSQSDGDWLTGHATLVVGIVGILVSGLLGPAATKLVRTASRSSRSIR